MLQTSAQARQQRWRQALTFGVPLGLIEVGIFGISVAYWGRLFPPLQAVLIGLLFYLVIPAIAGYVSRVRNPTERQNTALAGFRIGMTSLVTFMLGAISIFAALFIRFLNRPPERHQFGLYDPAGELQNLISQLGLLLVLHGLGVLLSAFGGRIGGALAHWQGTRQARQPQG